MKSQALTKFFPHIELTEIGLLIFFFFFIAMVVVVFHKSRRHHYETLSMLPFDEPKDVHHKPEVQQ